MKNFANFDVIELSSDEVSMTNGGLEPIELALAAGALLLAACQFAYSIGKDCAEADRRR